MYTYIPLCVASEWTNTVSVMCLQLREKNNLLPSQQKQGETQELSFNH